MAQAANSFALLPFADQRFNRLHLDASRCRDKSLQPLNFVSWSLDPLRQSLCVKGQRCDRQVMALQNDIIVLGVVGNLPMADWSWPGNRI